MYADITVARIMLIFYSEPAMYYYHIIPFDDK